jgi:exonuclease SbcD
MLKFLHAADIHLDSSLKGLDAYEGAPADAIRLASRRALQNLVQLAIDERVNFVLISGDLYDGSWPDYNTGLFFVGQAVRLRDAGIPLFLIAGNHDAAQKMTKKLRLPENVTLFPYERPDTVELTELGVAIHGQSFATQAVLEDLSANYPPPRSGLFNIGMLHTCATGREGHDSYAPCTLEGLRRKEYQYWALGHVHQREILCSRSNIVFPGNLQGRHIRETGPKGAYLVQVNHDHQCELTFQPLDVMRWELADVDVSSVESPEEMLHCVASTLKELTDANPDHPLAVRVTVFGQTPAHHAIRANTTQWTNEVRGLGISCNPEQLWIEKVIFRTSLPVSTQNPLSSMDGPVGELQSLFSEVKSNPTVLEDLGCNLSWIRSKLPAPLQNELALEDPGWVQTLLEEAESKLIESIRGGDQS